jgi:hypothetical protein
MDLTDVATSVTQTVFPHSLLVSDQKTMETTCLNKAVLIRWEFSDSLSSTFMPKERSLDHVMKAFEKSQKDYKDIHFLLQPHWFAQPYISALEKKGELRIFVIGLMVSYIVPLPHMS